MWICWNECGYVYTLTAICITHLTKQTPVLAECIILHVFNHHSYTLYEALCATLELLFVSQLYRIRGHFKDFLKILARKLAKKWPKKQPFERH